MKLEANSEDIRKGIRDAVRKYIVEERKTGIHLTELHIPLKYYFYKLHPEAEVTENEVYYFITGKGAHAVIEALTKYLKIEGLFHVSTEKEYIWKDEGMNGEGIRYTPDLLFVDRNNLFVPFEIKSTRVKFISKVENIPEPYLFQLKGYISLLNAKKSVECYGYLYAVNLTYPETGLHKLTLTVEDMKAVRDDLKERYNLLYKALREKNPDILFKKYGYIPYWAGKEMEDTFKKIGVDVSKYIEPRPHYFH